MRRDIIRHMKMDWTNKGVRMNLRRVYPPPHTGNTHTGWWNLLFNPKRLHKWVSNHESMGQ